MLLLPIVLNIYSYSMVKSHYYGSGHNPLHMMVTDKAQVHLKIQLVMPLIVIEMILDDKVPSTSLDRIEKIPKSHMGCIERASMRVEFPILDPAHLAYLSSTNQGKEFF